MNNVNKNYNVLIVEDEEKNAIENVDIYRQCNCKKEKVENAKAAIRNKTFDLIYFSKKETGKEVMEKFKDYVLLPKAFEKFAINSEIHKTYIHCTIIRKIISDNIKISEVENEYQEFILECILEKILWSTEENIELGKIFKELEFLSNDDLKRTITEIVFRHYAKSITQIIKFHKNKEIIVKKFFNKLIRIIQNDIEKTKGFNSNIQAKRIEVY